MKQVTKTPVRSFRLVKNGHMLTIDYMKPTMHAVTVTAIGTDRHGIAWAELTDRAGTSIVVKDTELDNYDIQSVNDYGI
jgi:hypothetical protein